MRCAWSDLPTEMCAHCLGHTDPIPPIDVAPAPRRPKPVARARDLSTAGKRAYTPLPRHRAFPALCVNPRCRKPGPDGQPTPGRPTGGRSNICPDCEDRVRLDLDAVADTWPDLERALTSATHNGSDPITHSPAPGIAVNQHVADVMRDTEATLAFYGRRVVTERGMSWPLGEPTPPELARWLARTHLPWLAAHPDQGIAEALCDDAASMRRRVWGAAYATPTHHTRLPFRCPDTTPPDDGPTRADGPTPHDEPVECGALVTVTWVDGEPMRDAVCERGHTIPVTTWMRTKWALRHSQVDEGAARAMLTAAVNRPLHTTESRHL